MKAPQTSKTTKPKEYGFNNDVGLDAFELHDHSGERHSFLNILCQGTTFQACCLVKDGGGQPKSSECLMSFLTGWVNFAGWPRYITCDRGLHNRGTFCKEVRRNGVLVRQAALESPEQIGRVERHGGVWKRIAERIITANQITGGFEMQMMSAEINAVKNEMSRIAGFAPSQWVLGKLPRNPGSLTEAAESGDLGVLQAREDGTHFFQKSAAVRQAAREAFIKEDCSKHVSRSMLRKAAPIAGDYRVGDVVCYLRKQGARTTEKQWSGGCRVIGFDGNRTMWVVDGQVPVCVAVDKVRPCNSEEALAYQYLAKFVAAHAGAQQGFVDARVLDAQPDAIDLPDDEEEQEHAVRDAPNRVRDRTGEPAEEPAARRQRVAAVDYPPPLISESDIEDEDEREPEPDMHDYIAVRDKHAEVLKGIPTKRERAFAKARVYHHAFYAERVSFPTPKHSGGSTTNDFKSKNQSLEESGRAISYETADPVMRAGLDKSRRTEWDKWKEFGAGVLVRGKVLQDLLDEGHQPVPMRWVDTDKNLHKRRKGGPTIEPELKSRLVGRGDLEQGIDGLRTDSPTSDVESVNLLLAWAAGRKCRVKIADISNAYFQGRPLDRVLLFRPPKGGLPGEDDSDGAMICARVPVYGTKDAGRGFWLRIREVILENGWKENPIMPAFYNLVVDGKLRGCIATHVDDLMWWVDEGYESHIDGVLAAFKIKKVEEGEFRFCGREITQDKDFNIMITCKDTAERIEPVNYNGKGRKDADRVTSGEMSQLQSVIGSLSWIARQARGELSYAVSSLQSRKNTATIKELKDCNAAVKCAIAGSRQGLVYKAGAVDPDNCVLVSWNDAGWAGEVEEVQRDGIFEREEYRSQEGRLLALAEPKVLDGEDGNMYIFSWKSTQINRVCRATLQAETFGMTDGVEDAIRWRATIAAMTQDLRIREWEIDAAKALRVLLISDCDSLVSNLHNPKFVRPSDKRLSVDLAAMRQLIWREPGDEPGKVKDKLSTNDSMQVKWMDTSKMVVDPMTKSMDATELVKAFSEGRLEWSPTPESIARKQRASEARAKKTEKAEKASA